MQNMSATRTKTFAPAPLHPLPSYFPSSFLTLHLSLFLLPQPISDSNGGNKSGEQNNREGSSSRQRKRLVVYQRDADRRLLSLDSILDVLGELLGPEWTVIPIVHDNEHEPCWLYSQLMDADMLLTPHGWVIDWLIELFG